MTSADTLARLKLQAWLSPGFPVGGFAYSQGLEGAHEVGDLPDAAALESWLAVTLSFGTPRQDAVLLALTWHAARDSNSGRLADVAELATALAAGRERRLESTAQGRAFARAILTSWPAPDLAKLLGIANSTGPAYPVAVGIAAAAHDVPLQPAIEAYLCAMLQNAVSVAARLGVVGQTDAQAILARQLALVPGLATAAAGADEDDLGCATVRAEIICFHHENQYSRLFRS